MKIVSLPYALAFAALVVACGDARAAESFDSCAGYIESVPATISTQGVWCLNGDLTTAITSGHAITLAANNITIDCNGFKLGGLAAGPTSAASGIHASNRLNATVRNCGIRGFLNGIYLAGNGGGHLVEDNRLDGNLYVGIRIEDGSNLVQRNRVQDTGGSTLYSAAVGISAYGDVIENTVDGVEASDIGVGITIGGPGTVARENQVRNVMGTNVNTGINVVEFQVAVVGNVIVNVPAAQGRAIWGNGVGNTFCSANLVAGYTTDGVSFCTDAGGNVEH